jgi:hypothetical protein
LVVVLAVAGVLILSAFRELKRLGARAQAYADLPVMHAAARAEADVARIQAAVEQVEPLLIRLLAALEVIRRGPFPPQFFEAIRRVRAELAAFRGAAAR